MEYLFGGFGCIEEGALRLHAYTDIKMIEWKIEDEIRQVHLPCG